ATLPLLRQELPELVELPTDFITAPLLEHLLLQPVIESGALFFFQAEDGIRDLTVTGVQTCALPISTWSCPGPRRSSPRARSGPGRACRAASPRRTSAARGRPSGRPPGCRRRPTPPASPAPCRSARSEERRAGEACLHRCEVGQVHGL